MVGKDDGLCVPLSRKRRYENISNAAGDRKDKRWRGRHRIHLIDLDIGGRERRRGRTYGDRLTNGESRKGGKDEGAKEKGERER